MKASRLNSAVPPRSRERFITLPELAILGGVILLVMVALFPGAGFQRKISAEAVALDPLTVAYLNAWLRAQPNDGEIRVALVRRLIAQGALDKAERLLIPLLESTAAGSPFRRDAELTMLDVRWQQLWSAPAGSPASSRARSDCRYYLQRLSAYDWDDNYLQRLAQQSTAVGAPTLALRFINRWQGSALGRFRLYGKLAEADLSQGLYRDAAANWLASLRDAPTGDARRGAFEQGLHALQADGLVNEALQAAQSHVKDFSDDWQAQELVVQVARAANRPDVAAFTAARMLEALAPEQRFDDTAYTLSYQAFIEHSEVSAAYSVASVAVAQRPDDSVWRHRLAQSAEWSGHPVEALAAWQVIARKDDESAAWEAIKRLAPSVYDDEALLAYWAHFAAGHSHNPEVVVHVVDAYEQVGRPMEGIGFLQSLPSTRARDESIAGLAERSGQDALAIKALDHLIDTYGPAEAWVVRRAGLLYGDGELRSAYISLASVAPRMATSDVGYWQMYSDLSRLLGHDDQARSAYRVLVSSGRAREIDLFNYASLLGWKEPLAAAPLHVDLFRRFGHPFEAVAALDIWNEAHAPARSAAFLAALTPREIEILEKNPDFLIQRGVYHEQVGEFAAARNDYYRGLQVDPSRTSLLANLVSLLQRQNDLPALRRVLIRYERPAHSDAGLWSTWADGWMALHEPASAIPYATARYRAQPRNLLAQTSLAVALKAAGYPDRASALMRRVAAGYGSRKRDMSPNDRRELEAALFADRLDRLSPDAALIAWRHVLSAQNDIPAAWSAEYRNMFIDWLQGVADGEATSAAIRRLYPDPASIPEYIAFGEASANGDTGQISRIMQSARFSKLSDADRAEAALVLGHRRTAVQLAYEGAEQSPNDDQQSEQLQDLLTNAANAGGASTEFGRQGPLSWWQYGMSGEHRLAENTRVEARLSSLRPRSLDTNQLGSAISGQTGADVSLIQTLPRGDAHLTVGARQGMTDWTHLKLAFNLKAAKAIEVGVGVARGEEATESVRLRVAGYRDRADLHLKWALLPRLVMTASMAKDHFSGQDGSALGSGYVFSGSVSYRLNEVHRETVTLTATRGWYTTDGGQISSSLLPLIPAGEAPSPSFFMPSSFSQVGLDWSVNESDPDHYERRWRPYLALGVDYTDPSGWGYNYRTGLGGSVIGGDRLSLGAEGGRGGVTQGETSFLVRLCYFLLF